jgi:hypothetical protein
VLVVVCLLNVTEVRILLVLGRSRPCRRAAAEIALVQLAEEGNSSEEDSSMAVTAARDLDKDVVPPLPPRYRFRDLILGDYAFNDDGER